MSYQVFFALSQGLARALMVPTGTKKGIIQHIENVEQTLNLTRTQFKENPVHWDSFKRDFSVIDNKILCETVAKHNSWVRQMWRRFGEWAKTPVEGGEVITPEDAQGFWHGFEMLDVDPSQWTGDYYRERMEVLYEVMRGRKSEGISFDTKALTPKQAAAVVCLFSEFLDTDDLRLDVPNGHDYLASSSDGGYEWCEKCGPMTCDDSQACRKRKCPLRESE